MSAGPLINQERARALLESAVSGGELPPAYLFAGPHGVGKEEAALALARSLNCERNAGETGLDLFGTPAASGQTEHRQVRETLGGCGTCSSCSRIGRYSHPDVIVRMPLPRPRGSGRGNSADPGEALAFKAENPYRDPEVTGGSLSIGIADVRVIIRQLAYAPVEARMRVAILREAERMTEDAQNALLKSMEEPPPHTLFILTTHRPNALLPTVRSRSRTVCFRALRSEEIASYLREQGIGHGDEVNIAGLAMGSVNRAIQIAEGDVQGREEAIRFLTWAVEGRRREALAWASGYTFKSGGTMLTEARRVLEELLSLVRDVASLQNGVEDRLLNQDMVDVLRNVGRRVPEGAGLHALEAVACACGEVDSNVNLALIYATLFDDLRSLGIN